MPHGTLDCEVLAEQMSATSDPIPLEVSASVQIEAEPSRVLYALAIPEYMEAWLQFPEMERIECQPELRSFDRFRIDLTRSGGSRRTILGSCLLSKPNRITYLWERDIADGRPGSMVEMRLWGGPSQCTLKLRHIGFRNQDEREWHSEMWPCSLRNLCKLMKGIGNASEGSNRTQPRE
jgi:uncharacterized protein YndB with AHSA1/START domain